MFCVAPSNGAMAPPPSASPASIGHGASTSQHVQAKVESEEIDIQIRNVVCNYSLPMHIDLKRVAMSSGNVTYDRARSVLYKQKRNPHCYVKVYSSGNVYIVGCRSEEECRRAARSVGRMIQRGMGLLERSIRLKDYKICNVLATCRLPFGVKIEEMAARYREAHYEPELSVGLVWKLIEPKASLRIHTTGSITITGATSAQGVMQAIEKIYPVVQEFRCPLRHRGDGRPAAPVRKRAAPASSSLPNEMVITKRARPQRRAEDDDPHCEDAFSEQVVFDDEEALYEEIF